MSLSELEDLAKRTEIIRPLYALRRYGTDPSGTNLQRLFTEVLVLQVSAYWVTGGAPRSVETQVTPRGDELLDRFGPVAEGQLVRDYIAPAGGQYREGWQGTISADLTGRTVRRPADGVYADGPEYLGTVTGVQTTLTGIDIEVEWDSEVIGGR